MAGGTIGADNIVPIDIMAFFITLAYIAVSLDATGLIRYLAYKVLVRIHSCGNCCACKYALAVVEYSGQRVSLANLIT